MFWVEVFSCSVIVHLDVDVFYVFVFGVLRANCFESNVSMRSAFKTVTRLLREAESFVSTSR